jgi:hypothetical protein
MEKQHAVAEAAPFIDVARTERTAIVSEADEYGRTARKRPSRAATTSIRSTIAVGTFGSNVADRLRTTTLPDGAVPVTSNDSVPGRNAALTVMLPAVDGAASDELRCALAPADTIKVMAAHRMNERAIVVFIGDHESFGRRVPFYSKTQKFLTHRYGALIGVKL